MDNREYLVSMIQRAVGGTSRYWAGLIADYLLAHGVTVQEWHPVSERMPENFVSVLGYMTDAEPFPPVRECYTVGDGFYFPALGEVHPVSHWREIPQPPKGE